MCFLKYGVLQGVAKKVTQQSFVFCNGTPIYYLIFGFYEKNKGEFHYWTKM